MDNSNLILIRMLLKSTSQLNIYKHCKDKKKRKRIVGNWVAFGFLYLLLLAYCVAAGIGYGSIGLTETLPSFCALTISAAAFILTLFKTNGYLFNFKEYDMLMSLPFDSRSVAGCKFLYMYVKGLPIMMTVAVSFLIGYAVYAKPALTVYPIWLILSFVLPIIPMLLASFIGFLIARVGAEFRHKNIIQTVLIMGVSILAVCSRFIIEDMFRNNEIEDALLSASEGIKTAVGIYFPALWFTKAIGSVSMIYAFVLIITTALLFELVFIPVGRTYRKINSKLKCQASAKKFRMTKQKKSGVRNAIAFKELKRMTGSPTYMINAGMGEILALILGGAALFVDFEKLVAAVTNEVPISTEMLYPAIPLIVYFCIGMVATTAISPSLEGKNYWIVQSLPVSKKTLYQGKMLFNMYLTVPFMLISTISIDLSAKVPLLTAILTILMGLALCAFSTAWGCVCGIKHMRLDWENEVEVIKQGAAVSIYLFPNLLASILMIGAAVALGNIINRNLILSGLTVIVSALALVAYKRAVSLAERT